MRSLLFMLLTAALFSFTIPANAPETPKESYKIRTATLDFVTERLNGIVRKVDSLHIDHQDAKLLQQYASEIYMALEHDRQDTVKLNK